MGKIPELQGFLDRFNRHDCFDSQRTGCRDVIRLRWMLWHLTAEIAMLARLPPVIEIFCEVLRHVGRELGKLIPAPVWTKGYVDVAVSDNRPPDRPYVFDRIESGRKTTARKQQDRKKLARKLWGLGSVDEEEEQDEGKKR